MYHLWVSSHFLVHHNFSSGVASVSFEVDSVVWRCIKLDEYRKEEVWIEVEYEDVSWNALTFCFNCITKVANTDKYKAKSCDIAPIRMQNANNVTRENIGR